MIRAAILVCVSFSLQGQNSIACPATIGPEKHLFDRISIYNGKQGGQEYELAPDEEKKVGAKVTQSWFLKDCRTMNIFLRCRYQGTEAVTSKDIPANIKRSGRRLTLRRRPTAPSSSTSASTRKPTSIQSSRWARA